MPYPPDVRAHHLNLLAIVHNDLLNRALWRDLTLHTPETAPHLPRPLLTGLPPEPVYPEDKGREQIEWVLPVDIREKWSLRKGAEVFDGLPEGAWGTEKTGVVGGEERVRAKRVLLAVVAEDSTVVYYVMHEGIVKPRQN